MKRKYFLSEKQSTFLEYLLAHANSVEPKIPPIKQIGIDLGLSTPNVRELMELARNMGVIQIQPRVGITLLPYKFTPAVTKSVYYAIKSNLEYFNQFSELRNHLEKAYFIQSINLLDSNDLRELQKIVEKAKSKLARESIQIPHQEHRSFHMKIYQKTENIFLQGLLEAYWDMYELVGLDMFTGLTYLKRVWDYHERITSKIIKKNYEEAFMLLSEHIDLIYERDE